MLPNWCCVCSARKNKDDADDLETQNVFVSSDGSCFWWTSITHSSSLCRMNIAWFPLDTQRCSLLFESWTMDSQQMNMTAMNPAVDLDYYKPSGEWELAGEYRPTIYIIQEAQLPQRNSASAVHVYYRLAN